MEKQIQGELKGFKPHQFKKPDVEMTDEDKPEEEEEKDEAPEDSSDEEESE